MHPDSRDKTGRTATPRGTADWIDLSGVVNRRPWPVADLPPSVRTALPTPAARDRLAGVAAGWFGCLPSQVLPVAGEGTALRRIARLLPAGRAAALGFGDTGHAACLRAAGWQVAPVATIGAMAGADLAIVVNPADPDGREWPPGVLARLARRVGHLVVDETFADARPDLSAAPALPPNALILRGLSVLWGLTGLRTGLAIADPALLDRLSDLDCPDGPALHIAALAMADRAWADDTILYLAEAALRLDRIATTAGWRPAGGTHLFRLYDTPDAARAQAHLERARIRSRRFGGSPSWLRLAIPVSRAEWDRLTAALHEY